MTQKDIFLTGEGDNWYARNLDYIQTTNNFVEISFLQEYLKNLPIKFPFLEIGCGGGNRTIAISRALNCLGYGIDPSQRAIEKAIESARKEGVGDSEVVNFKIGTADHLDFGDNFFDFVYFGFCLYLIDRNLIEVVVREANRVLKHNGYLAILDFHSEIPRGNPYKHDLRITSYKDDYSSYFEKLNYSRVAHLSLLESGELGFSSDPDKQIAFSLLKKVS